MLLEWSRQDWLGSETRAPRLIDLLRFMKKNGVSGWMIPDVQCCLGHQCFPCTFLKPSALLARCPTQGAKWILAERNGARNLVTKPNSFLA